MIVRSRLWLSPAPLITKLSLHQYSPIWSDVIPFQVFWVRCLYMCICTIFRGRGDLEAVHRPWLSTSHSAFWKSCHKPCIHILLNMHSDSQCKKQSSHLQFCKKKNKEILLQDWVISVLRDIILKWMLISSVSKVTKLLFLFILAMRTCQISLSRPNELMVLLSSHSENWRQITANYSCF